MISDVDSHFHAPLENKNQILTVSNSKPRWGMTFYDVYVSLEKIKKLIKSRPWIKVQEMKFAQKATAYFII